MTEEQDELVSCLEFLGPMTRRIYRLVSRLIADFLLSFDPQWGEEELNRLAWCIQITGSIIGARYIL